MNEIRRLAYLQAMATDSFVSRWQLPGAAPTRRLAIVRTPAQATAPNTALNPVDNPDIDKPGAPRQVEAPRIDVVSPPRVLAAPPQPAARLDSVARFSLAAIVTGGWLWLEELDGMPLASDQVQLVEAMATALDRFAVQIAEDVSVGDRPAEDGQRDVAQFNWPIHTNRQLDIGPEAARSSVAGFIRRKLEQHNCRGLVLLGDACEARVPLDELECRLVARTVSTAAMLADARLKKQAWRDLRATVRDS